MFDSDIVGTRSSTSGNIHVHVVNLLVCLVLFVMCDWREDKKARSKYIVRYVHN